MPDGDEIVMLAIPPFVEMGYPLVVQFVVAKFAFCCRTNTVEEDGHETTMLLPDFVMARFGGPGVCNAAVLLVTLPLLLAIATL